MYLLIICLAYLNVSQLCVEEGLYNLSLEQSLRLLVAVDSVVEHRL